MKILVTGGAGFIGSHTVVELVNAGYTPVIVDNFCNSRKSVLGGLAAILGSEVVCHEGDCCNPDFMDQVFEKEKDIEGVIHFAALKSVSESIQQPERYHINNIGSLETLMRAMEQHGVRLLVFSSSATVYGHADRLPVTEQSPVKKPESPYGATKIRGERIVEEAVAGGRPFRAVSLRYFNPIGAHESARIGELPIGIPNNLVPFITQTAAGNLPELIVFGDDYNTPDGTPVRDYIHVVDLARAHVCALKHLASSLLHPERERRNADETPLMTDAGRRIPDTGCYYDVFNLGTGHGNSVLEVIRAFEEVTGVKVNYRIGPRRPGDIESIYANCDKAAQVLGWTAGLTLADGLRDAWRWQVSLG